MSERKPRTFETKKAVRSAVPLLIGIVGPSSSGKTFSSLRLATGIQRVTGGDIHVIDTESRRACHYADDFTFEHTEFDAPFNPLGYLDCVEHCVNEGAKVLVIDNMSHEHDGPGGVLEYHDAEAERLVKLWGSTYDKVTMSAWQKPKAERRRLIQRILQLDINIIFCFRAKEKIGLKDPKKPIQLGWMPIAGDEFVYEMTACALLEPGANGVPNWNPDMPGSKTIVKRPKQFTSLLQGKEQLSEDLGEKMARWAKGDDLAPSVYQFSKGEHAGELITEVPSEYLVKLSAHESTPAKIKSLASDELDRRGHP